VPEPATSAAGQPGDEFDALLTAAPAPAAAPSARSSAEPITVHDQHAPSFGEFAAGWELGIYQDPVLCGALAGIALGLLGVFVVLRRAVFVTAAVSQSAGLGVALAFMLDIHAGIALPPVAGAFALASFATLLLGFRMEKLRLPSEAVLGFAYAAASAGAVLVGDRISQEAHDVAAILFGTAVLVRPLDLALVAGVGLFVLVAIACSYRGLVFAGFDREGARVQRLPVRSLEMLLWLLVALEVSVTTRALGALPVFAFAVLPAMAALAVWQRLRHALIAAALIGGIAGGAGYVLAFFLEFPVGASQSALASALFLLALLIGRLRGAK
jgi:zinc transport system permease protein